MFCLKCGKEIEAGAKFCPHCGAATSAGFGAAGGPSASTPPEPPVYTMPSAQSSSAWSEAGQDGNKRRGMPLLIGGIAAAALVVVLIVVAIGGLFSSPKGQVEKAIAKTAAAYAGAGDHLGLPDLSKLLEGRSYTQHMSFALNSLSPELTGWYDLAALKGLGVRMDADYDQKGRKMDAEIAAFWDSEDLAVFQMLVDGGDMLFASPQFTRGEAYGLNTETLGKDLVRLGAQDDEIDVEKISFNLFDLMDKALSSQEQAKEAQAAMGDAYKQLFDAIQVEKGGKQKVEVNGKSLDATLYHVVVPEDAMKDYINAWEDAMKLVDAQAMSRDILLSMGFDKGTVDDMLSEADVSDIYSQMADTLKQAVKTLGDLELEVYVSGGYVSAVEYSDRIQGTKVEVGLYLGGGENYVDDLSLEVALNGQKLTIQSTGDHAAKSGVFTDETTLRADSSRLTSELRWEPKADNNNFEWELKVDNTASLSMEGQLTATKNSIDLKLEDLSVKAAGSRLLSLEASYYLGPCQGMRVSFPSRRLLSDMDEDDLMDLAQDIESNAQDWAYDVMDRLPADLLNALY